MKVYNRETPPFAIDTGVRQGCVVSPCIFNCVVDWIMRSVTATSFRVTSNCYLEDLDYADDIALFADNPAEAQRFLNQVNEAALKLGLNISATKTKIMSVGYDKCEISLNGNILEEVSNFVYLGSKISKQIAASDEVTSRIGKAAAAFGKLRRPLWSRKEISVKTKLRVYKTVVVPTLLYGCESWTLLATDISRLEAFQSRCLRNILGLSCRTRTVDVYAKCSDMLNIKDQIKSARLRWMGHVSRMTECRLPKKLLLDERPSHWKCPRNAPKKQWKDQVLQDLKPLHFTKWDEIVEAAQNRYQWRGLRRDAMEAATSGHGLPYRR